MRTSRAWQSAEAPIEGGLRAGVTSNELLGQPRSRSLDLVNQQLVSPLTAEEHFQRGQMELQIHLQLGIFSLRQAFEQATDGALTVECLEQLIEPLIRSSEYEAAERSTYQGLKFLAEVLTEKEFERVRPGRLKSAFSKFKKTQLELSDAKLTIEYLKVLAEASIAANDFESAKNAVNEGLSPH